MLNQTVIVGRLCSDPEVKELDSGKKVTNIKLAVQRAYKNEEGNYGTDFIDVTLWDGIADNTAEYCKKGDIVGVKGRLQSGTYEKNGEKKYNLSVVAEKVTFLASKNKDKEDRDDR